MPTRLIDSTPPPIVISCWPDITCAEAKLIASRPEAQKRLICKPPRVFDQRDARAAPLAPPRLADWIDPAEHRAVEHVRLESFARLDGAERLRREIERGHLVQRAVVL